MKGFKKRLRLLFPPNRVSKLRPAKIFNFYFFIAASREGQNRKKVQHLEFMAHTYALIPAHNDISNQQPQTETCLSLIGTLQEFLLRKHSFYCKGFPNQP